MIQAREDYENQELFTLPASETAIQQVARRMQERNMDVVIVDDGERAKSVVLALIPQGAEVHSARSRTLEETGIFEAIHDPSRYTPLRPQYTVLDRQTQGRAIRKLVASPDYMVGSVNAVTQDGLLIAVSASGSQLGPYVSGAERVILVVGSQKIVPNLESALQRIHGYALEEEDRRVRASGKYRAVVGKLLVIEREWVDGRITVVLVRRPVGV